MSARQTICSLFVAASAASVAFFAMGYQRVIVQTSSTPISVQSDPAENASQAVMRFYDVHSLLGDAVAVSPEQFNRQFNPFVPVVGDDKQAEFIDRSRVEDLRELITRSIDPDSWEDNGGDIGRTGHCAPGMLIIIHTPRVQRQVERLLQLLNGEP